MHVVSLFPFRHTLRLSFCSVCIPCRVKHMHVLFSAFIIRSRELSIITLSPLFLKKKNSITSFCPHCTPFSHGAPDFKPMRVRVRRLYEVPVVHCRGKHNSFSPPAFCSVPDCNLDGSSSWARADPKPWMV